MDINLNNDDKELLQLLANNDHAFLLKDKIDKRLIPSVHKLLKKNILNTLTLGDKDIYYGLTTKGVRIIQDNLNIKIKFYENNRDFYEKLNVYKYNKEDKK
jgi:DNA-binding PadR family transcriptional regulator